jgi:GAF domain-containing protein
MTALSEDELADLARKIAALEEQLRSAHTEREAAIERQTAATLEQFRLQTELRAALDRQKASAEILRNIAATSGDAAHALRQIAETTAHFFNAPSVTIRIAEGDRWVQDIRVGSGSLASGAHPGSPLMERGASLPVTVYQENRQIHIPDLDNIDPSMAHWPAVATRAVGIRTLSGTPLRREGQAIGALIIYRDRLAPFTDEELALQQSFADQAVIAIENARLFNETKEALERQTATADILKVIASSPSDARPVFEAIATSANRLVGGFSTAVHRVVDDVVELAALTSVDPEADGVLKALFPRHRSEVPAVAFVESGETAQIADIETGDELTRQIGRARNWRSVTFTPLMNKGACIGFIACTRREPGALADRHVQLLRTFADQAVIAIENARLFNETQEALARQTATSEILRVISGSPTDVQPVFDAIVRTAVRLLGCDRAFFMRVDGHTYTPVAGVSRDGPTPLGAPNRPIDPAANFPSRAIVAKQMLHLPDWAHIELPEHERRIREMFGVNSALYLPLLRGDDCIGLLILIGRRANMFGGKEIALAESFRDQALIAIENTRLFNETQEALERQTATSDILRVIASSPADVQPVFEAIAERSNRLVEGVATSVFSIVDDVMHLSAFTKTNPAADAVLQARFPSPVSERPWGYRIRNGETVGVPDTEAEAAVPPDYRESARLRGFRSMLMVPLLRNEAPLGVISVTRREPGPFAAHHVQMLQTFADQAVIAIENVRLFNETREALERQTATADILKVIASSPSDVKPVFEAIVASANRLLGGFSSTVYRFIDGQAYLEAFTPTTPEADEILKSTFPLPLDRLPPFEIARAGEVAQIPDTETLTGEILTIARARGFRSMLFAPLMNKGRSIGIVAVTRAAAGTFADHHVQLLKTFADQAVIAIENARLFDEVQAKTRDLEESLQQQTATSDVLRVIASSPTDVMPVLNAIVESACQLCEAIDAYVALKDGDHLVFQAHHGAIPVAWKRRPINRQWPAGRAVADGKPVHLHDVMAREGDDFPDGREIARRDGARSVLTVPLMREGESVGVIILRRIEVQPFTDKQIALLQTFADQAVIAIENTRLFDQVQARTRDLSEALEQQTATSEVLSVISSSAGDLAPVFDAMLAKAMQLCSANFGVLNTYDGEHFLTSATYGLPPAYDEYRRRQPLDYRPGTAPARLLQGEPFVEVNDLLESESYRKGDVNRRALVDLGGARCLLAVPLVKDERVVGNVMIFRQEQRRFSEKQIALLQQFAAQAVIAIENARLLGELRQRTTDLSKSLNDLRTAQDRLVQTEKLASLGQLTAGIAHEIKNPLNFVNNFSALSIELTDELKDLLIGAKFSEDIRKNVDELTTLLKDNLSKVVQHGKRADSIVKNMLLHSREGSGEHRPSDVNALVEESLNLAYHGARAEKPQFNVNLQRDFDPEAGMIEVFPQEITRVLLNLISNGFYAVTKRKADNGSSGFEPLVTATTKGSSSHVEIRIRDNGTGIPPDVKEKMFNPFFTTKPAGEGTGLGLSMSHDIIVKQHGGTIDVDTEPGVFTEFTIVLPRTKK